MKIIVYWLVSHDTGVASLQCSLHFGNLFFRDMQRDCAPWWLMGCTSWTKLLMVPIRKSWWREPMPLCWILTSVSTTGFVNWILNADWIFFFFLPLRVNLVVSLQGRIPSWRLLTAPWAECALASACLHHMLAECTVWSKPTPPGWALVLSQQSSLMWEKRHSPTRRWRIFR